MPSKSELIHYRLQAMLREHSFSGDQLEYLGVRKDSVGIPQHWYKIGGEHEVPVDAIEELNSTEEE